jgi:hypothetical protein
MYSNKCVDLLHVGAAVAGDGSTRSGETTRNTESRSATGQLLRVPCARSATHGSENGHKTWDEGCTSRQMNWNCMGSNGCHRRVSHRSKIIDLLDLPCSCAEEMTFAASTTRALEVTRETFFEVHERRKLDPSRYAFNSSTNIGWDGSLQPCALDRRLWAATRDAAVWRSERTSTRCTRKIAAETLASVRPRKRYPIDIN